MSKNNGKLPIFVDNQDGNTMASAIIDSLKQLRNQNQSPEQLKIASAYFNPQGLQLIAKEAKHLNSIQLLLGAEPTSEVKRQRRLPGDTPDPNWTEKKVEESIENLDEALREERNHLPFNIETDQAIKTLLKFLTSEKIEARRYTTRFLHAKAFLFTGSEESLLTGSSNLTRGGLKSNLELNLGIRDPDLITEIKKWYQKLWEESEPYDLAEIYQELFAEYTPYEVYLMVLWQLYGKEIIEEDEDNKDIRLANFQEHGVKRAMRILEKYNGVLIADGVGLGKTYTAGAIIRDYAQQKKSILVICPAALRDSTWKDFKFDYKDFFEIVSYEQLREDRFFGGRNSHLGEKSIEKYALIVIDEAHNYRNPDTKNAEVLRELLRQRKKLILLTATPVNNSIMDLYVLYSYFLKQDASLSDVDITSLLETFKNAAKAEPNQLNPDLLFPIIDATTVKRPRNFIKEYYPNDKIPNATGGFDPLIFPKPVPIKVTYQLDELNPDFFEDFKKAIMPEKRDPEITLARYKAENYLLDRKKPFYISYIRDERKHSIKLELDIQEDSRFLFDQVNDNPLGVVIEPLDLRTSKYYGVKIVKSKNLNNDEEELQTGDIIRSVNGVNTFEVSKFIRIVENQLSIMQEGSIIGLLRSNLLKRFESSIKAFSLTLERLIDSYGVFIKSLENGKVPLKVLFQEYNNTDDDEIFYKLLKEEDKFDDISKYDIDRLKNDLDNDLIILSNFKSEIDKIDKHSSSKLAELKEQLKAIIQKAERDSIDEIEAKQNRKVMIFSYFEETVDWIYQYLKEIIDSDPELAPDKNSLAVATGRKEWDGLYRDEVIYGFAPITTKAPDDTEDRFDLLICTDVLAEGLNLQQCRNIINYDLPWNPMRLIQRHGRIDRLKSKHKEVYLYSFFPDSRLDELLKLEYRIRNKLAQAAASIGIEDAPIVDGIETETAFSDTFEDIQGIYDEKSTFFEDGGGESATQTGEIYRAELRRAIKEEGIDLTLLPRRVGSSLKKGKKSGYFFCAEVTFKSNNVEETRTLLRFVPNNMIEVDEIIDNTATCLRMIECTKDAETIDSNEIMLGAYDAWDKAKESIMNWWLYRTDPMNLQPEIPKINREVANFLISNPPSEIQDSDINYVLSCIEAPWSRRDSNQLRETWKIEFESNQDKANALYKKIKEIGAEPYIAPQPLTYVEPEDIRLICWMAIVKE